MNRQKFSVIRALSGRTRYKIVRNLIDGGATSLGMIASTLGMSRSATGHQLSVLLRIKILKAKKRGRNAIYQVATTPAGKTARAIMRA